MRFWPDRDDVCDVVWYFVPRDRPFLPLEQGWLFTSEDLDPANEGMGQPRGFLDFGADYLSDPVWSTGKDPVATKWVPGVFQGTPEEWRGLKTPGPVPRPDPMWRHLPPDCCGHAIPFNVVCTVFDFNTPSRFNVTVGPVVSTDVLWQPIPARVYSLPWLGLGAPCTWFLAPDDPLRPVQSALQVGGSVALPNVSLIFLAFGGVGGLQFRILSYAPETALPAGWQGERRTLKLLTPPYPNYTWPATVTIEGVP